MQEKSVKEDIKAYFTKQIETFNRNFALAREEFNVTSIHKMRLSVKRTRALFQFLAFISDEEFKAKEYLANLRKLFKLAGFIREIQVQQLILMRYEMEHKLSIKQYYAFLDHRKQKSIDQFKKKLGQLAPEDQVLDPNAVLEMIELTTGDDSRVNSIRFINNTIYKIALLKGNFEDEKNTHKVRILTKQFHYLMDILKNHVNHKLFINISLKKLKIIEEALGNWHDRVVGLIYLEEYQKAHKIQSRKSLVKLKEIMEEEAQIYLKQINYHFTSTVQFSYAMEI